MQPAGDHDAVVCRVAGIAGCDDSGGVSTNPEADTLGTQHLREAGII